MSEPEKQPPQRPQTYGPPSGPCPVCGKKGGLACGRCRVDFYCGKEHQTLDWPRHRKGCGALELRKHPYLGRHLVATKDIPAGTVIMREVPLVAYPKQFGGDVEPVCVGCCKPLSALRAKACSRCGWPVCDEACSDRQEHQPECAAFQRAKFKLRGLGSMWAWSALATLRVCLASKQPVVGPLLRNLESELPDPDNQIATDPTLRSYIRMARSSSEHGHKVAIHWLRREAGLAWLDEAELMRWASVIFINGVILRAHEAMGGLFAGNALLEHACVPNVMVAAWAPGRRGLDHDGRPLHHGDLEHVVVASRDIAQGEHLAIGYKEMPLRCTADRRIELAKTWGFACRCAMCLDPTEGGLHLAAWYCAVCKGRGLQQLVSLDADGVLWSCDGCDRYGPMHGRLDEGEDDDEGRKQAEQLHDAMEAIRNRMRFGEDVALSEWESFLRDALWPRGPLHATSQTVLVAKREMQMYEPEEGSVHDYEGAAARIASYTRDILAASETLCPGHIEFRGALQMRLAGMLRKRLDFYALAARTNSRQWPRMKQGAKGAKQELTALLQRMKRYALKPYDKQYLQKMTKETEIFFKKCLPAC